MKYISTSTTRPDIAQKIHDEMIRANIGDVRDIWQNDEYYVVTWMAYGRANYDTALKIIDKYIWGDNISQSEQLAEHIVNIWENDKALKNKYIDQVWDIITAAYESIGGCNCDKSELFDNNIYWKLTKRGERITALSIYKLTPYGRKMFIVAAEASPQGKTDIRKMMEEDAKEEGRHFYGEVSEAPEYMYIKRGAKMIPISAAQRILGDKKKITPTGEDDYHYTREIGPDKQTFRKVMVGNPKIERLDEAMTKTSMYTWVIDALESGLDDETKIRVYSLVGESGLIAKGTINDIYKECRINDRFADATIHNWYAWSRDDIVINLEQDNEDIIDED